MMRLITSQFLSRFHNPNPIIEITIKIENSKNIKNVDDSYRILYIIIPIENPIIKIFIRKKTTSKIIVLLNLVIFLPFLLQVFQFLLVLSLNLPRA